MIRTIPGRLALSTTATLAVCLAGLPALALGQSEDATDDGPTDALTSVVWAVTSVGPSPPATDQTIRFEPDGGLVASTGCADYAGTYSLDGEVLTVDSMRREFGSLQDCTFGESGSADLFVNIIEDAEIVEHRRRRPAQHRSRRATRRLDPHARVHRARGSGR